eukprot:Phypoly_transcript_18364.p1 GENE.Phypoly_transcript_18364~~Phypoly_transcript_18364.p1  ORF type:complete len:131 (+),score=7.76 Phypoly_transcript_18364:233-625(+)
MESGYHGTCGDSCPASSSITTSKKGIVLFQQILSQNANKLVLEPISVQLEPVRSFLRCYCLVSFFYIYLVYLLNLFYLILRWQSCDANGSCHAHTKKKQHDKKSHIPYIFSVFFVFFRSILAERTATLNS